MHRLPADLGRLADRLRRVFGDRDIQKYVSARGFEVDDLRIDGRVGCLVCRLQDDHRTRLFAEPVFEAFQIVFAVIVVLVQHTDLGVGVLVENVAGVDPRLALISRLKPDRPREMLRVAPVARSRCGTFFAFMYLWIAVLVGVPAVLNRNSTWSLSTSLRTCSTVL